MIPPSQAVSLPGPVVRAGQRILLRARSPALRRGVQLVYQGAVRAASLYVARGASVYLRGSLGTEEFVPGLSDADLVFVDDSPAGADLVRKRWARIARIPPTSLLMDWPRFYDRESLRDLTAASVYTWAGPRSVEAELDMDGMRTLGRPGLLWATHDWRLVRGPDRRPPEPERDAQARRAAAWLELIHWWRLGFLFCAHPSLPRAADLSVKLVTESARIWLWLVHGERPEPRADVLHRVRELLPEEDDALALAAELQASPPRGAAPLGELLPAAVRLSSRVAAAIAQEVESAGVTHVCLIGVPAKDPLPLVDWRGIVFPGGPDEAFEVLPGDPGDPVAVAAAAAGYSGDLHPVLAAGDIHVLPGLALLRTRLRSVECPLTDPVPFALRAGAETAAFPEVPGWSALDTARRAVTEHRALLRLDSSRGTLLTAARAALFLESVLAGRPELCVSAAEAGRQLANDDQALRRAVLALPAYQPDDPLDH